jgi:RNase P subunit RPR2
MITEDQILEILATQKIYFIPKYRRSLCSACLKEGNKFWHIWLNKGGYKKEVHICRKCGEKYGMKV